MDSIILKNTEEYAKDSIFNKVVANINMKKLVIKKIYVPPKDENDKKNWRAALVDAYTQAGKTWKCFDLLTEKVTEKTLILFVTQANSVTSASQILQRAKVTDVFKGKITSNNIYRSSNAPDGIIEGNYMLVDFWNSKNTTNMIDFVKSTEYIWDQIIIVIDECDQGAREGIKNRLDFIKKIEKAASDTIVNVIFITATVANLSKHILEIAKLTKFKTGVIQKIIDEKVVEHHFVTPHESYVGPSWFNNEKNDGSSIWKRLVFPKKTADMSKDEYNVVRENEVLWLINTLPESAKELSLIVTSTRVDEHRILADKLYRIGYNVTVELNGETKKNYSVKYVNHSGNISVWNIPYSQIEAMADNGDLDTVRLFDGRFKDTCINQKEDVSLSYILQGSLFMATCAEKRIKDNISEEEYIKLFAISEAILHLDKSNRRPKDYPLSPRVALIAGHLAGRGITIQNPMIDFTCTSFCFTETKDSTQRGAINSQRFGRACGMLSNVFARAGRMPILISTPEIMQDAIANEQVLFQKASLIDNGSLITLKDLISKSDWDKVMKETKNSLNIDIKKEKKATYEDNIDGVNPIDLKRYYTSKTTIIGQMINYLYKQTDSISFDEFKKGIKYDKEDKQFQSNVANGCGIKTRHGMIWIYNKGMIEMNPKIREIINNF